MGVARLALARALVRALVVVPVRALADVPEIAHRLVLTGVGRGVQQTVLGHARVALERALI